MRTRAIAVAGQGLLDGAHDLRDRRPAVRAQRNVRDDDRVGRRAGPALHRRARVGCRLRRGHADPQLAAVGRNVTRRPVQAHLAHDTEFAGVDPQDGLAPRLGNPDGAVAVRDRARPRSHVDRFAARAVTIVEALEDPLGGVHDPHRAAARRERGGAGGAHVDRRSARALLLVDAHERAVAGEHPDRVGGRGDRYAVQMQDLHDEMAQRIDPDQRAIVAKDPDRAVRCRDAVALMGEDLFPRAREGGRVDERGRALVDVRDGGGERPWERRSGGPALRDPQPGARGGQVGRRRAGRERVQPCAFSVHLRDRLRVGVEDPRVAVGCGDACGRPVQWRGGLLLSVGTDPQNAVGDRCGLTAVVAARRDGDPDGDRSNDDRGCGDGQDPAPALSRRRRGRRRRRTGERDLAHDRLVQRAQALAGFDAQLLGQHAPPRLVDVERLGLPARAIQREHQLPARALTQRLARHEVAKRRDRLGVVAEDELRPEPLLLQRDAQLAQCRQRVERERRVGEVRERLAAPQRECFAQRRGRSGRIGARELPSRLLERALAADDVDGLGGDVEEVAGRAGHDGPVTEDAAQLRDVALQRRGGGFGRVLPHALDQATGRYDRAGVEREHREDRSAARAAERKRLAVGGCLQGTQQAVVEGAGQGAILRRLDTTGQ